MLQLVMPVFKLFTGEYILGDITVVRYNKEISDFSA